MRSLGPIRKLRQFRDRVEQLEAELALYKRGWPPGHFYSPIPSPEEVRQDEERIFHIPPVLRGVHLEPDQQLSMLDALTPYFDDQPFEDDPRPDLRYFFLNDYFMHGDALVLHALLRHLRPKRVIEIGSGYSSAVLLDTNERFLDGSAACTFVEPEPERLLELMRPGDIDRVRLIESRVQDVELDVFTELEAGDFLLVDSSHVSKAGSDVNVIVFEILPRLAVGVYVHFHDVRYPFEYPAEWIYAGRAWNEAYLLRSFLEYNHAFEIVLFNNYLATCRRSEWLARVPLAPTVVSSLWLRRVEETGGGHQASHDADLMPPPQLMKREQIDFLEDWFQWAFEWAVVLRAHGGLTSSSNVLEIGCGLGRVAFALRHALTDGTYDGFDISAFKIEFAQRTLEKRYPNFRFVLADVHNSAYNPTGTIRSEEFTFPYDDESFDLVFAASLFTHLLPEGAAQYFRETGRCLRRGGRAVFSVFLLDFYEPGRSRPGFFAQAYFDFDHTYGDYGDDFAVTNPDSPEDTTAFRLRLLDEYAQKAGLRRVGEPLPGRWSGAGGTWVSAQEFVVYEKAETAQGPAPKDDAPES